ncbi:MAG: glycosyltransferase family 4 protein [bacterium]|nr:glycosyltransferase family 4 protein [bacterium]
MKIGIVTPYFYPLRGGVQEHVYNLYLHFKRRGHIVKIITSHFNNEAKEQDIIRIGRGIPIPINGSVGRIGVSINLCSKVKETLRKEEFDLLHIHEPLAPTIPLFMLKYSDCINIGTFHAGGKRSLSYSLGRGFLKKYFLKLDGRIVVSHAAEKFVRKYFGGEFQIIPNGIDTNRFREDISPIEEYKDEKLNILFVGRFDKRKGLDYLLSAFKMVKKEVKDIRLIVVGGGYKKYKKRIGDIVFTGVQYERLPQYYSTCDIFCSPAIGQESFGIILLEAMALGKPVVATNIPGYNEVVTHNKEGLLVPPKDKEALRDALIKLLRDKDLRIKMGKNGREKAAEYSWERIGERVLDYYNEIIKMRR